MKEPYEFWDDYQKELELEKKVNEICKKGFTTEEAKKVAKKTAKRGEEKNEI